MTKEIKEISLVHSSEFFSGLNTIIHPFNFTLSEITKLKVLVHRNNFKIQFSNKYVVKFIALFNYNNYVGKKMKK